MSIKITREAAAIVSMHVANTAAIIKNQKTETAQSRKIVETLSAIYHCVQESINENTFNDDELLNMTEVVYKLLDRATNQMEGQAIQDLSSKMNDVQVYAIKSLRDITVQSNPRLAIARKIESNMELAKLSLPKAAATGSFPFYPYNPTDSFKAQSLRTSVDSIHEFSAGAALGSEIFTEITPLKSCQAFAASTKGYNKEKMKARSLADSFVLKANGKRFSALAFGVFEGHGGTCAVDYFTQIHHSELAYLYLCLQERLEQRLQSKDPNDEDIFYALQETISSFQDECLATKNFTDSLSATIGFKIEGIEELWIANIGTCSACVNRKGQAIPMSTLCIAPNETMHLVQTPEIFKLALQMGDQLVMFTHTVPPLAKELVQVLEQGRNSGCFPVAIVENLVQASVLWSTDDVCAMIVNLNKPPKNGFIAGSVSNAGSEKSEKKDPLPPPKMPTKQKTHWQERLRNPSPLMIKEIECNG
jgi:hypothetical protein